MADLVVATFNSHWGVRPNGRPYDLVAACRLIDADALVLQEAWQGDDEASPVENVASALGYSVHYAGLARGRLDPRPRIVHPPRVSRGTWGLAILSRLPVEDVQRLDLGHLLMDPAPRAALRVDLRFNGTLLSIFGTHLSHLSHGSLFQLRKLRSLLPSDNRPAVLAGDLNMWGPVVTRFLP
ncbi:MAG: endonuclease/exonuclease/phosphatase family protein, partial [Acidimicrobiales bacterium]